MGQKENLKKRYSTAAIKAFCPVLVDDMLMLASLHDKEPDKVWLDALRNERFPEGLGLKLIGSKGSEATVIMDHALKNLPEQIDNTLLDALAADYASIYLNHGIQASPEESIWVDKEKLACQESMFQVRSWYEQYGLMAENWRIRPDDHLVLQLRFLAHLFSVTDSAAALEEGARFMDEHLLRWITPFAERVAGRCETPYYAGIALLTSAYCEELRDLLATILGQPRPSPEEIEARMSPGQHAEEVPVSFMPGMGPAV
ncbi:MAG: molecular chaperone TorD family protein [Gammaproteobacteria bacterium]|nr:molecular chaperone TorD family protein [Gammaproteobacteria bacterium]